MSRRLELQDLRTEPDGAIDAKRSVSAVPMSAGGSLASHLTANRRAIVSRSLAAVTAVTALCGPSTAQDANRSVYSTIDLKSCATIRKGTDGAAWRCAGLPGYPVYIAEGDDRFFLSVGPAPERRRASQQTLKPFNTLFPAALARTTIEWRVPGPQRRAAPYATIVRYYTSSEQTKGQVLVVSKVTPDQTCHVALIDADANPDAMERARVIADTRARSFDCTSRPTVEGAVGKSPL